MILDEIVTLLAADVDVNALIAGRIYTEVAPDAVTLPYVMQTPARLQLDCWATTLDGAIDLADKVETAMVGASTFAVGDFSRETDYDPDVKLYRMIIDTSLWT
jgi:hypothetical protein